MGDDGDQKPVGFRIRNSEVEMIGNRSIGYEIGFDIDNSKVYGVGNQAISPRALELRLPRDAAARQQFLEVLEQLKAHEPAKRRYWAEKLLRGRELLRAGADAARLGELLAKVDLEALISAVRAGAETFKL